MIETFEMTAHGVRIRSGGGSSSTSATRSCSSRGYGCRRPIRAGFVREFENSYGVRADAGLAHGAVIAGAGTTTVGGNLAYAHRRNRGTNESWWDVRARRRPRFAAGDLSSSPRDGPRLKGSTNRAAWSLS